MTSTRPQNITELIFTSCTTYLFTTSELSMNIHYWVTDPASTTDWHCQQARIHTYNWRGIKNEQELSEQNIIYSIITQSAFVYQSAI